MGDVVPVRITGSGEKQKKTDQKFGNVYDYLATINYLVTVNSTSMYIFMKKKRLLWRGFTFIFSCISTINNRVNEKESNGEISVKNSALSQKKFFPTKNGYKLVWEDNFEGTTLNKNKWDYRLTGPRRSGYNSKSMVKVENGNLLLMYDIRNDSVFGAMIGTQKTYMTRYGYFECRAKVQNSPSHCPWGAFWIQSPHISEGEDPGKYGAEIDIMEYYGDFGDRMTHNVHWAYGPNQKSSGQLISYLEGVSKGYHTYGLEWTPEKYAFYIDGLKFHEIKEGISHIDEYIILSMEIPFNLEKLSGAIAPDTFKVDYVRVYKK